MLGEVGARRVAVAIGSDDSGSDCNCSCIHFHICRIRCLTLRRCAAALSVALRPADDQKSAPAPKCIDKCIGPATQERSAGRGPNRIKPSAEE